MKPLVLLALLGASSSVGCNAVDRAADCQQICSRYRDCVGPSSYDVGSCASRCRDNAANSDAYDRSVDVCQACIDNRPCSGAVFNCLTECGGIVP